MWIDYETRRYCTETEVIAPLTSKAKFITIRTGEYVYILDPLDKTARKIPASEGGRMPFESGGLPDYKRFGGVPVGSDSVAGYATDIYEYIKIEDAIENVSGPGAPRASGDYRHEELEDIMAGSARQSKVRAWIWKETGVPLKTIVDFGRTCITTETVNIAVNVDIPERVFTVPEEYTIRKMQQ